MSIGREALAEKDGGGDRVRGAYLFPYLSAIVPVAVFAESPLQLEKICRKQ
jgi:hypothetical protein